MHRMKILGLISLAVASLVIGILIGHFAIIPPQLSWLRKTSKDGDPKYSQQLHEEIKAEEIHKNLKFFASRPHIAGSVQEEEVLVKHIHDTWKSSLHGSKIYNYKVLLSYPNASDPNYVSILSSDGVESDIAAKVEKILSPDQNDSTVVNPFNAYSPSGVIVGDPVYVNYGTVEDFQYLTRNLTMNLTGTVAIARYGKVFRGDKVNNGAKFGCAGMILYSDPADYVVGSLDRVYPVDWWLPGTGAQRGTVLIPDGDPLTPFYPSTKSAFFLDEKDIKLPQIPVTPIGYNDAVKYLSKMSGMEVPNTWKGRLNITYRVGPGFVPPYEDSKIKLHVKTYNVQKTIRNVFGFIEGQYEPDRYVVLGNHRDAWVFGAIDPSSGTATMMEVSRALSKLLQKGWRPRRSILFCSWGAEEFGLIGSTESVEELGKVLGSRTVAYLNVDLAVSGNSTLRALATPILHKLLFASAKKIENPNPEEVRAGRRSVYDTWVKNQPSSHDPNIPRVGELGSGSDYAPFLQIIGVSAADLSYRHDQKYSIASYPMYHSVYETVDLVSRLMDRGFYYHQAVARLWGEMALRLADDVILYFDCVSYAETLKTVVNDVQNSYGAKFLEHNITLSSVEEAVGEFLQAAKVLQSRAEKVNRENPLEVREINDQLMQLERSFIDPLGVAGNLQYRHVIYAPNQHNLYAASSFPGLASATFDIEHDPNQERRWQQVKKEISIIAHTIASAASTIQDPRNIGGGSTKN
ncbi:putative N-acetylated-alpha-linked acidic dipeptidase isoform X2 [Hyla sarda]|nr:putative N-acetylated-alpha-linked acidic dipeptidase isoform X2 [Hyla sarda]XP_056402752.1 putative N-acetylated-alpha-linked acidic dipeptidase isoform X2 [Hyla sarda]XP_056402753.1 putative N-acetylated-alpha-linked acidic dipeptidase isoform X2 [Hyla sarda]XP_056402754.1 putative N-acetylated-alpha-linked acidic dipeptidase isoform X2 [Hyla sarda]XP_056402755.1 putative N-acetylated-alpha-linked acidic dipeptidase isoform X2 [Hyla sarda]XP_056402757.1 putative N-acetylated-alpha-linked 